MITDFTQLHSLIGQVVEIGRIYSKMDSPGEYYSESEIAAKYPDKKWSFTRYRGRLGVFCQGQKEHPIFLIDHGDAYHSGHPLHGQVDFIWIDNQSALIAAKLEVIS